MLLVKWASLVQLNCSANFPNSISDSRLSTAEESVQMIKNELVPCLENSMDKLQKVWNEIGISEEQKEERTQVVLEHLQNLLKEMVNEEEELKTTLLGNVAMCTEELIKISGELGLPCYVVGHNFVQFLCKRNLESYI